MLTAEEERFILASAYIPEHIVGLMTCVSGGEPYLVEDHFCCRKGDWVILVGYPLKHDFTLSELEIIIDKVKKQFHPKYISLIAPELPVSLAELCQERETDYYYTLDIHNTIIRSSLRRAVKRAKESLTVECSKKILNAHHDLIREFIERVKPQYRVKELLVKMPEYVGRSSDSMVLNAWGDENKLAAFYIIDQAARNFSSYVIGCHSKENYIPGASDLLCFEMIEMSKQYGKHYIHLGLGVNEGIRGFKKKWGGTPTRRYEMCELLVKKHSIFDTIMTLRKKS